MTRASHQVLLTLVLVAALAACTELDASLVEVEGRRVEVVEAGAGDTTVVFESGLGADWTPWDFVAKEVVERAPVRVFAYSRPGYGDSEPTSTPRDAPHIVEELRGLLAARGYTPPYVLVGHSFGGAYMELFARAYPEEVAGVVLVDPRHRDLTEACQAASYTGCFIPPSAVERLPQPQRAEVEGFAGIAADIAAAGPFGAYPVRVLTATSHAGFSDREEALWQAMLGSLAAEAANGEQIIYPGATHSLHLRRPYDVVGQILRLLP